MTEAGDPHDKIVREINHPLFDLYLRSDDIVVRVSKDDAWYTIKEAREFVELMHEITNGIPHLFIVVGGRHSSIDKEALTYMTTPEAMKDILATAVVTRSVVQRIITNLAVVVDGPAKPIQSFDNIDDAVKWLKMQKS